MSVAVEGRIVRLRGRVSEQEAELRVAVQELEEAARRAFDLRHHFASHPLLFTTGAFLVGVWLGGRGR